MNLNALTRRNLAYHARQNLVVLLGVAVGTAVLTGALLIGDSLRYSLTRLTEERLGWVEQAVVGGRLLRQSVVENLNSAGEAPVLLLRGTATSAADRDKIARKVQILGVDARFWNGGQVSADAASPDAAFWNGSGQGVAVNAALAQELGLQAGDTLDVSLLKATAVPRETLLGDREGAEAVATSTFTVERVVGADEFGAKFSLQPTLETVRTVFVPLAALQAALGQAGKVNGLLLRGGDAAAVSETIRSRLKLEDLGLKIVTPEDRVARLWKRLRGGDKEALGEGEWFRRVRGEIVPRLAKAVVDNLPPRPSADVLPRSGLREFYRKRGYLSLESDALLIEPVLEAAALAAAKEANLKAAPTLVYLVNTLAVEGKDLPVPLPVGLDLAAGLGVNTLGTEWPYVLVAGVDPALPPLGGDLPDDQIVLVDWPGLPWKVEGGEKVKLVYYPPEQHGDNREETAVLTALGALPLKGALIDPDLTPEFPGVTDKDDIGSWKPPFKIDRSRVEPGGLSERFWEDYRTTPRAYLNLATAEKLFGSRYGKATSVRLYVPKGVDEEAALETFEKKFRAGLSLDKLGLVVQSVKAEGLQASGGAMNFAGLFLGFSFFLIAAALLLVGLLFRLNLERRAKEIGILAVAGYSPGVLRGLLLREGTVIAVVGSLLGVLLALGYSRLLIQLMQTLWPGGMLQGFLRPSWTWVSLLIGFAGSVVVALGTIWWVVRGMAKVPPRLLIAGKTADESDPSGALRPPGRWQGVVGAAALILGLLLLPVGFFVPGHEAQAGTFFGSGALFLTAGMFILSLWLRSATPLPLQPGAGTTQLALRNLARNPGRSLLTVGLIAAAAFLLVAVESFRRSAGGHGHGPDSPDGGFALVGESELPVVRDLNSPEGRGELIDALQARWQKRKLPDLQKRLDEAEDLLKQVEIVGLRTREGDDASCLNLYQPRRPRVLGVPPSLHGFVFAGTEASTPEEKQNPWLLLAGDPGREKRQPIPAFGENNTVVWMLQKSLGGTVEVPDAAGEDVDLRVAGLLRDSVFQSSLLVGEKAFLRLYPTQEGFRFFLIRCPPGTEEKVKALLQTALEPRGLSVQTSAQRLNDYLAIENTYLSTFQALGGLGLVLGSLGLVVVLLRSVWERLGELALLQALGYSHANLTALVLVENALLLLLGLVLGTAAALLSIAPQVVGHLGTFPVGSLSLLLGLVLVVGLTATVLATWGGLRQPLPPALRRE